MSEYILNIVIEELEEGGDLEGSTSHERGKRKDDVYH